MILFDTTQLISKESIRTYRLIQIGIAVAFIVSGIWFAYRTLFPSQEFSFSFENPDASKNTLEDPTDPSGASLSKGRIPEGTTLRTYAGTVGSFSEATFRITLENDSPAPKKPLSVSVRKSYRSFFLPEGENISSPSKERAFVIAGTPYFFSDGFMSPFISDAAALSHFPKESIMPASEELLKTFPSTENSIGFRPGTLISDTEGVYAIGGDGKAHPIGSTDIFEALGFSWNDVLPANAEELQFHKRGKIILADAAQPDGTIFSDTKNGKLYLIENGSKRLVSDKTSSERLRKISTPIEASEESLHEKAQCTPQKNILSWNPTYECTVSLAELGKLPGGSFEISLDTEEAVHASAISISFETKPDRKNLSIFLFKIRERFESVYGNR